MRDYGFHTLRDIADRPESMRVMTYNCGTYINALSEIGTKYIGLPQQRSIYLSHLNIEQFGDDKLGWTPSNYKESLHVEKNDWWTDCNLDITNMMFKSTGGLDYDQLGLMNICKNNPEYYRFDIDLADDW